MSRAPPKIPQRTKNRTRLRTQPFLPPKWGGSKYNIGGGGGGIFFFYCGAARLPPPAPPPPQPPPPPPPSPPPLCRKACSGEYSSSMKVQIVLSTVCGARTSSSYLTSRYFPSGASRRAFKTMDAQSLTSSRRSLLGANHIFRHDKATSRPSRRRWMKRASGSVAATRGMCLT